MEKHRFWQVPQGLELHQKIWDEKCVVFNASNATTYLLDILAAEVLELLSRKRLTLSELSEEIASDFDFENINKLENYLESLMDQMAQLELVEPIPS